MQGSEFPTKLLEIDPPLPAPPSGEEQVLWSQMNWVQILTSPRVTLGKLLISQCFSLMSCKTGLVILHMISEDEMNEYI